MKQEHPKFAKVIALKNSKRNHAMESLFMELKLIQDTIEHHLNGEINGLDGKTKRKEYF